MSVDDKAAGKVGRTRVRKAKQKRKVKIIPIRDKFEVGDLVNWESQGVTQFSEPKKIESISADGQWILVEGSKTGLPVSEIKHERGQI